MLPLLLPLRQESAISLLANPPTTIAVSMREIDTLRKCILS